MSCFYKVYLYSSGLNCTVSPPAKDFVLSCTRHTLDLRCRRAFAAVPAKNRKAG